MDLHKTSSALLNIQDHTSTTLKQLGILRSTRGNRVGRFAQERRTGLFLTQSISVLQVERVSQFQLLGVWQQNNLRWNYHVEQTIKKACKRLYHLRECRKARLPREVGITIYYTKIRPLFEYVSKDWGGLPQYLAND